MQRLAPLLTRAVLRGSRRLNAAPAAFQSMLQGMGAGSHSMGTRAFHASARSHGKVIPFILSDIGEGIAEVEITEWNVKPGDTVEEFDQLLVVQSDKATVEITSRFAGTIKKLHYDVGDMAATGSALVDIEVDESADVDSADTVDSGEAPKDIEKHEAAAPTPSSTGTNATSGKVLTTPAVRALARRHNLDLTAVRGTGKQGRILKEDVLRFMDGKQEETPAASTPAPSQPSSQAAPTAGMPEDRSEPIRGLQRAMVKSMNKAWSVPHFGYCDEVVMEGLVKLRRELKPLAEAKGVKLSYMPLIIKATSLALSEYPQLNAWVNDDCSEITYKGSHNISIAVDSPRGLIVPNIKGVQQRNIFEISQELMRLQELAQDGRLTEEDLKNGTFSLSNIGAIGGTYASPVLLVPQIAIGALGKVQNVACVLDDGEIVGKPVMQVSWAADHRVVDGATMARFSNLWKEYLENPMAMLTAMKQTHRQPFLAVIDSF